MNKYFSFIHSSLFMSAKGYIFKNQFSSTATQINNDPLTHKIIESLISSQLESSFI